MAQHDWFPEFRDQQLDSKYPFADSASLTTSSGAFAFGPDTFLDAAVYPLGGQGRMYISGVSVAADAVVFTVSDETATTRCQGTFNPTVPTYTIPLFDQYGRPAGMLLSSPTQLATFTAWSTGSYAFTLGATEFAAGVTIPTPEAGLRGLLTADGELLTGDVWIVGDNGVVVRQDTDGSIRIDVVGDPLFARKLCTPIDLFQAPLFVQTINHCPPDEYGNYNLTVGNHLAADTILRISPAAGGLQITAVGQPIQGTN